MPRAHEPAGRRAGGGHTRQVRATRWQPRVAPLVLALAASGWLGALPARAQPVPASGPPAALTYYLQAFVNGLDKGMIVRVDRRDERYYISAGDLDALGILTGAPPGNADREIPLDTIPGLAYAYDAAEQRIDLRLPDTRMRPEDLAGRPPPPPPASSATGLLLNYSANLQSDRVTLDARRGTLRMPAPLLGSASYGRRPLIGDQAFVESYETLNRTLSVATELRFFSPYGVLLNSGYTTLTAGETDYVRQDTYWTYTDVPRQLTYTVGDYVSASLQWTRAIRLGGFSLAKNFATRPDLVTFPVPALGGTAVVPTTVDLYINGLRQFTGQASGGPFVVTTPPALTGAGNATLVYRDPLGREVTITRPLYLDTRLVAEGLADYAVQAGYARRSYGAKSFDYAPSPAAMGTLRYGISNVVTLEAHAEGGSGLRNLGAGALVRLGQLGVANAAVAGSAGDARGGQLNLGYQYNSRWLSVSVQGIRATPGYRDLGSLEGVPVQQRQLYASVGVPITGRQSLSLSYARQDSTQLGGSRIVSMSYSASVGSRVSVYANVFRDLDQRNSVGAYLGLTFNLDGRVSLSANASSNGDQRTMTLSATRPVDYDKGGFGWNVVADAGNQDYRHGLARLDYRGSHGDVSAQLEHGHSGDTRYTNASLYASGSLVLMQGDLLAARQVYDAFAMVSTDGLAGVPVLRENRVVGETNSRGHFIVPDLLPYDANRLAIDTLNLPVDANVATDRLTIAPPSYSGVLARFPVKRFKGATVILQDAQGRLLPPGTRVTVVGTGETALVGYDGEAFLPTLQPVTRLSTVVGETACEAEVRFNAETDTMKTIGPFPCVARERP